MDVINKVQELHDQLKSLCNNFRLCYDAQMDNYRRIAKPQKRMMMYVQHFMRVLDMSIERGEIKNTMLQPSTTWTTSTRRCASYIMLTMPTA